ncbi:HAD family hydrolase [Sulfurisphaera ohwakuensis]|uniref:FMN phosphatase YigB (HAD superfamily) n=1 Tax=Sulfurisphaera ohwakuensis TaxID=69656 RepID=A0A650CIP9_SULOH|nr:HAD family hydrolase [Sulfurisphaera ohwakuensis]MBB5253779.1 FMN phosphatase YigB (HAD superfamily) [Sulfurisphaera ohwakuensis]QGR17545.1 HAD hydrolase-like protein [Sulfurisphaera ohwakuensis]
MYVFAFNFLNTIAKVPDNTIKDINELQCVITTYTLAKVYVPYSVLLQAKGVKLDKLEIYHDSLLLEEISYRARIFIITNLEKKFVKEFLLRNNIDVFVQDVISAEEIKRYKPSPEFFDYLAKRTNSVKGAITIISSNPHDIIVAKSMGFKAYWLNRSNLQYPFPANLQPDNILKSITSLAESTAQHKVDSSMGDSALRCT